MKTFEKISTFSAVILMAVSMNSVYAEQGAADQNRIQERVRTELNLQVPASEVAQSRNRKEHTVLNENKNQYQYRYMNKHQNSDKVSAGDSRKSQNAEYNIWQGNTSTGPMNRNNTAKRSTGSGRY